MLMEVKDMTGEQLLVLSVLGGPKIKDLIDRALDNRAILGRPPRVRRTNRWAHAGDTRAA